MEVQSWPARRVRDWMTYFQVVNDLEREAMEDNKSKAARDKLHQATRGI